MEHFLIKVNGSQLLTIITKRSILDVAAVRGQFLGSSTHADIIEFSNFLVQFKRQRSSIKTVCGFSIIFVLKGIMTF